MSQIKTILTFWFGEMAENALLKPRKVWFTKHSEFDEAVRSQFQIAHEQAATGQFDGWQGSAQGCLALVLLLDQFPRNMFRGQPESFASDAKALSVAQLAIAQGFDCLLPPVQRQFLYFPLEHSENLEHQNQAVALFHQFVENPDLQETYDYAIRHREIIQRFGRFPHRNQILGRDSTPEEVEFLKQPGSSF
ncbi:MAG: DUF924 domain-containing protein [Leptolyngbyaceae cyanobacterium CSU_1_3]|nr:DUF924 domain-containing protein [Leptolyngbyaceae cyanobacterium CSU_1_3]